MCHDLRHISGDNTTSATDNALCWGARGKKKKEIPRKNFAMQYPLPADRTQSEPNGGVNH